MPIKNTPDGTFSLNKVNGYVYEKRAHHPRTNSSGWIYQHVLIMERKLGRFLVDGEHVHHVNGIKHDNVESNLELKSESEHHTLHGLQREHNRTSKYRWVRFNTCNKKWQARVGDRGVSCDSEHEAALEADRLAFDKFGIKVKFNFPDILEKDLIGTIIAICNLYSRNTIVLLRA